MSNEFVARKGLVSLRSSSFEETIRVSGSIYSPAEAFLTASWAVHAVTASYVDPATLVGASSASIPNTIALRDIYGGTGMASIQFDATGSNQPAHITGMIDWNLFEGTLDVHTDVTGVTVQVGQEMIVKVRNNTGTLIPNGAAVYISGSLGNRPLAWLAIASDYDAANSLIGLATNDMPDNTDGYVTVGGKVNDLNTFAYTGGQVLYLSDTVAGGYTTVPPTGSSIPVILGRVVRSHVTLGSILVNVRQNFLDGNHIYAVQQLEQGVVTASLYGTASYATTASYLLGTVATASYALETATDYNQIYTSFATGSQTISVANSWQEDIFNANSNTSSYWVHSNNTGHFTCSRSDVYELNLHVRMQKTGGGNQSAGVRMLKNGQEISGSYSAITYTSNNIASDMHVNLTEAFTSGSTLSVQIAGTATTVQTTTFPTFGATPSFTYSSRLLITKS